MMKHDTPITTTACGECRFVDRKILHHVCLSGTSRRLCTTCVLRLHPQCFCPSCLVVYDRSPPDQAVVCYKCHSSSHRTCVSPPVAGSSPCSTCVNPNGLNFDFKSADCNRGIDLSAARLLLAAAEISSLSMSKAEVAAVTESYRRAKEASDWRKSAKEAINHVVKLMEVEKKKRDDNHKAVISYGNGNNNFVAMPVMDVRIDDSKVIASFEVSEALNAVKLAGETMASKVQRNEELGVQNERSLNNNHAME